MILTAKPRGARRPFRALCLACGIGAAGVLASALSGTLSGSAARASDLIYQPINPGFGGYSNNVDYLLSLANIQNTHAASGGGGGGGGGVPVINFPPITIDLGGIGGTPAPTDPAAATGLQGIGGTGLP